MVFTHNVQPGKAKRNPGSLHWIRRDRFVQNLLIEGQMRNQPYSTLHCSSLQRSNVWGRQIIKRSLGADAKIDELGPTTACCSARNTRSLIGLSWENSRINYLPIHNLTNLMKSGGRSSIHLLQYLVVYLAEQNVFWSIKYWAGFVY